MTNFSPKKIVLSNINEGRRFVVGDAVTPEAINDSIEASAYSQQHSELAHQKADEALNSVHDAHKGTVTLSAYPIGSIYMSTSDISPAELFGGTWAKMESKFLLGTGAAPLGSVGGTVDLGLQLYRGELEGLPNYGLQEGSGFFSTRIIVGKQTTSQEYYDVFLPPYYAVNMWKRTA